MIFLILHMSSNRPLTITHNDSTLVKELAPMSLTNSPSLTSKPSVIEERSVPWDSDEEQAAQEADKGFDEYLKRLDEDERLEEEMRRQLESFERTLPLHSPSPL